MGRKEAWGLSIKQEQTGALRHFDDDKPRNYVLAERFPCLAFRRYVFMYFFVHLVYLLESGLAGMRRYGPDEFQRARSTATRPASRASMRQTTPPLEQLPDPVKGRGLSFI
jgi:hypothetical protein